MSHLQQMPTLLHSLYKPSARKLSACRFCLGVAVTVWYAIYSRGITVTVKKERNRHITKNFLTTTNCNVDWSDFIFNTSLKKEKKILSFEDYLIKKL